MMSPFTLDNVIRHWTYLSTVPIFGMYMANRTHTAIMLEFRTRMWVSPANNVEKLFSNITTKACCRIPINKYLTICKSANI